MNFSRSCAAHLFLALDDELQVERQAAFEP